MRERCFPLYLVLPVVGCIMIGCALRIQALEVGASGPVLRMAEGEVFSLHYIQSMYRVPVTERLRVENGRFVLFHVISSDAALEYLGIEKKEENNVRRELAEFLIPRASIGKHALTVRDRRIDLCDAAGQKEEIRVRMAQMPLITYATRMWR